MTDKSPLKISDPTIVSYSAPGETRWGYHQFPALTRLPDGRILLVYADAEDASESHGAAAPAFISSNGEEWSPFYGPPRPVRPHFSVTDLGEEALALPASAYFDAAKYERTIRMKRMHVEAKAYSLISRRHNRTPFLLPSQLDRQDLERILVWREKR